MQVIISHTNIDFDGFASLVAAQKLYPNARIVLPEKISIPVQHFLAIYRDSIKTYQSQQINWRHVRHIIMVDIASLDRVGSFASLIDPQKTEFTIYDHHCPDPTDIVSKGGQVELVGAAVTLLIEQIIKRKIDITSFEATLMAIGLYSDTGSFTYLGTTSRDLHACAYLFEKGANLSIVAKFVDRPLLDEQQRILNALLVNAKEYQVRGVEISVSWHSQKEYQGGMALLAEKMMGILGSQAVIIAVEMAKKVFLIGRSRSNRIDVLQVISQYGGGGHKKAASAIIKGGNSEAIIARVAETLDEIVRPATTAKEIMSHPVKIIAPETSIADAAKMMLRYGHTGFPVVENEKLVGIISRRDIEKAVHHQLGHAPVKGFMSKQVVTIDPEASFEEIQNIMIEHNVGRLLVIDDSRLLGIVSRTDVIACLHGSCELIGRRTVDSSTQLAERQNVNQVMIENIPREIYELLWQIGSLADQQECNIYMIGGIVRDLMMEKSNEDIDIVIEGDGIAFAELLAKRFGGTVRGHEKFGTATWKFGEHKIDITTARREYYEYPAALPTVERSTLKEDLFRRDFTLNAMAIQINSHAFGELIDYFHGRDDIQKKQIRVLYNLSFVEDPTRILRAVRFELRFGFQMDDQTVALVTNSLEQLTAVSTVRLAHEFKILFQEQHPVEAVERFATLGVWNRLLGEGNVDQIVFQQVRSLREIDRVHQLQAVWFVYLAIVFYRVDGWQQQLLAYALNKREQEIIRDFDKAFQAMDGICSDQPFSHFHYLMSDVRDEAVAFVLAIDHLHDHPIIAYLKKRAQMPTWITGKTLIDAGIKPGPEYKKLLFVLECAYLDGEVKNADQAIQWVKRFILEGFKQ